MSFVASSRPRSLPVLPLASMVDVIFLLLIFFMTNNLFRQQEAQMPVALQGAQSGGAWAAGLPRVVITIDENERLFIFNQQFSFEQLADTLRKLHHDQPNQMVIVRPDMNVRTGMTVRVLDLANDIGFADAQLAVSKPAGGGQ